jgi:Alanyl-tRNA synthetase
MEWLETILREKGIPEAVASEVVEAVSERMKNMIPKHRFDEVNEARKALEAELKERDKQLAELKKAAGEHEELRKQIEALQQENKAKEQEFQARLRDMAVTAAIKLAVAGDAHDPDLVAALVDKSKIEVDENGAVKSGLDEQLKELREKKPFLFIEKASGPQFKGVTPAESREPDKQTIKNPWSKEHFNLTQQARLLRENPELAQQLKAMAGG